MLTQQDNGLVKRNVGVGQHGRAATGWWVITLL